MQRDHLLVHKINEVNKREKRNGIKLMIFFENYRFHVVVAIHLARMSHNGHAWQWLADIQD